MVQERTTKRASIQGESSDEVVIAYSFAAAQVVATVAAGIPFTCPAGRRLRVTRITEVHSVVAGQAGTMQVEKLSSGTANGGKNGDNLLADAIDLTGTIHTPVNPDLVASEAVRTLEAGDRLALVLESGAATSLANANITIVGNWV
jgi:hypothetical protein